MHVLIYEPVPDGHHMADLSRLLPGILELPVDVTLATVPETLEFEAYHSMVVPVLGRTKVETCCVRSSGSALHRNWQQYRECVAMVHRFRPDHLYVMMGDAVWWIMELFRLAGYRSWPRKLSADTYLVRGGFAYPEANRPSDRLRRFLFRRMLRSGHFDGILMLDEQGAAYAEKIARPGDHGRAVLSPAPLVQVAPLTLTEARQRLGLPTNGKLVMTIGMICELRGVSRILRAFKRLIEMQTDGDLHLVLAGPHDDDAKAALDSADFAPLVDAGLVLSIDRYLNDEEMFTFAAAPDVLAVGTHRHGGRSSVIVWAAANGRPVVTTNTGSIGWVVDNEELGWTCDVTDAEQFAQTLHTAIVTPWTDKDSGRARAYASWHDVSNYRQIGTHTLREKIAEVGDVRAKH